MVWVALPRSQNSWSASLATTSKSCVLHRLDSKHVSVYGASREVWVCEACVSSRNFFKTSTPVLRKSWFSRVAGLESLILLSCTNRFGERLWSASDSPTLELEVLVRLGTDAFREKTGNALCATVWMGVKIKACIEHIPYSIGLAKSSDCLRLQAGPRYYGLPGHVRARALVHSFKKLILLRILFAKFFWIKCCLIWVSFWFPNSTEIDQNINAKMHFIDDSIFGSIFRLTFVSNWIPETLKPIRIIWITPALWA